MPKRPIVLLCGYGNSSGSVWPWPGAPERAVEERPACAW
jgi:hypothetical protein